MKPGHRGPRSAGTLHALAALLLLAGIPSPVTADLLDCREPAGPSCPPPPTAPLLAGAAATAGAAPFLGNRTLSFAEAVRGHLEDYAAEQQGHLHDPPPLPQDPVGPDPLDPAILQWDPFAVLDTLVLPQEQASRILADGGAYGVEAYGALHGAALEAISAADQEGTLLQQWGAAAPRVLLGVSDGLVARMVPFNALRTDAVAIVEPDAYGHYLVQVEAYRSDGAPFPFTDWSLTVSSADPARLARHAASGDPFPFLSVGSSGGVDRRAAANDGDHRLLVLLPAFLLTGAALNDQLATLTFSVPGPSGLAALYSEQANDLIAHGLARDADVADRAAPTLAFFRTYGGNPLDEADLTAGALARDPAGTAAGLPPYVLGHVLRD